MNAKMVLLIILAAIVGNQLGKEKPKVVAKPSDKKKIDGHYQNVKNYGLPPITATGPNPTPLLPTDAQRRANR